MFNPRTERPKLCSNAGTFPTLIGCTPSEGASIRHPRNSTKQSAMKSQRGFGDERVRERARARARVTTRERARARAGARARARAGARA